MREAIAMLVMIAMIAEASEQNVPVPPKWTTSEQVTLLFDNLSSSYRLLTTRFFIHADNNVLPLRLGDKETLPPMKFEGNKAYYFHTRLKELGLNYRRWSLRYGYGKADFYEGNKGAAQLFLDTKSDSIDWLKVYEVNAYLRRTHSHQWALSYTTPVRLNGREGQCSIAFR